MENEPNKQKLIKKYKEMVESSKNINDNKNINNKKDFEKKEGKINNPKKKKRINKLEENYIQTTKKFITLDSHSNLKKYKNDEKKLDKSKNQQKKNIPQNSLKDRYVLNNNYFISNFKINIETNSNKKNKFAMPTNEVQNDKKELPRSEYINAKNDDNSIDIKELNEIPFTQALRIDKRSFCKIFLYILLGKIEIINIFFYKSMYIHLSMSISIYLFSFLLEIAINCLLYTDDVVSEKYHNEGSLEMFTSLSLSFFANIISSIITYILKKLGEYTDLLEIMTKDISLKKYYYMNVIKFRKYMKLRFISFYLIQFSLLFLMTYYITIFCIVFNKSQVSIMINFIYGILESLGISFGISLVITFLRYLSLKYKFIQLYRTSQYLNNKF